MGARETGLGGVRSEKWMTGSKMEMKMFAELRVVALRPDRQEMNSDRMGDHPMWCRRLYAEFYYLAGILWLSLGSTVAQWLALLLHSKRVPDLLSGVIPANGASLCFPHLCVGFMHMLITSSHIPKTYKWIKVL